MKEGTLNKMRKEIDEMVDSLTETAKENLKKDGNLLPILAVFREEMQSAIIGIGNLETDNKHQIMEQLGIRLVMEMNMPDVAYFAFISDSYYSSNAKIAPSQDPNRKECIMISIVGARNSDHKIKMIPYERKGDEIIFKDADDMGWKGIKNQNFESPLLNTLVRTYNLTNKHKNKIHEILKMKDDIK